MKSFVWLISAFFASNIRNALSLYTPEQAEEDGLLIIESKEDFRDKILKSDSLSLVQFYAPWCGHCKQFSPTFLQISSALKGIVNVAVVDATNEGIGKMLASTYNVTGFPTMKVFGADKKNPKTYSGAREVQNIIQFIMNEIVALVSSRVPGLKGEHQSGQQQQKQESSGPSKVVELTSSNFASEVYDSADVWLVAFTAPWCGHCKALTPEWRQAAEQLAGQGVQLGNVDATVHNDLAGEYGVKGFPTIKVFPGGKNKSAAMATDYQSGRTASDIVREALKEVDRSGTPPELIQLTSQKLFDEICTAAGKSTVCVLVAFPHILESSAEKRNEKLEMLQSIAKEFRGTPFRITWFEGGSQPDLEQKLEMTFGFPAVVALNLDKSVYSIHRFSFNAKAITSFLYSITTGRANSFKLQELPSLETTDPWDGQDGEPIEEESLADILGDDWENEL